MTKKTIREAIIDVLQAEGRAMSAREIFETIQSKKLYDFKAKDPANIVRGQLRRHSVGSKSKVAPESRCFEATDGGLFKLRKV